MAKTLALHGCFMCMHKFYTVAKWQQFAREAPEALPHVAASSRIGAGDFDRLKVIIEAVPQISFICLDMANCYSEDCSTNGAEFMESFIENLLMIAFFRHCIATLPH